MAKDSSVAAIALVVVLAGCSSTQPSIDAGGGDASECPEAGSVVAANQNSPASIAVDSTRVYWADMTTIMSVPISGGAPTTLASISGTHIRSIAVDVGYVYWTVEDVYGPVMRVPLDGGAAETIATNQNGPFGIAVDATGVYWTNYAFGNTSSEGSVMRAPLDGGAATAIATGGNPYGIAVDGANVFYTVRVGQVMSAPLDGGAPSVVAQSPQPTAIALDATNVYWLDRQDNEVRSAPKTGGAMTTLASFPPRLAGSGDATPEQLVVSPTTIYWVVPITALDAPCGSGSVMSVPLDGNGVTTLAAVQNYPQGIAINASDVYWTNYGEGTVRKLPHP